MLNRQKQLLMLTQRRGGATATSTSTSNSP
jgi:hypothetical protein